MQKHNNIDTSKYCKSTVSVNVKVHADAKLFYSELILRLLPRTLYKLTAKPWVHGRRNYTHNWREGGQSKHSYTGARNARNKWKCITHHQSHPIPKFYISWMGWDWGWVMTFLPFFKKWSRTGC